MSWYIAQMAYNFPKASLSLSRGSTSLLHVFPLVGVVGLPRTPVRGPYFVASAAVQAAFHAVVFQWLRDIFSCLGCRKIH